MHRSISIIILYPLGISLINWSTNACIQFLLLLIFQTPFIFKAIQVNTVPLASFSEVVSHICNIIQFFCQDLLCLNSSNGSDKCLMCCIHHTEYHTEQFHLFTLLHPLVSLEATDTHHFCSFIFSMLSYRVIRYVIFSYQLLSVSHTHFRFTHDFSWLTSSSVFITK